MNSQFEDFWEKFKQDVFIDRESLGEGLRKSFVQKFCESIPDADLAEVNLVYFNQICFNRRLAADGYVFNSDEHTLTMVICDWNNFADDTGALTKSDCDSMLKKLRNFFELSRSGKLQSPSEDYLEFSSPEYGMADLIRQEVIHRLRFFILSDRRISERLTFIESENVSDIPVEVQVWTPERLYEFVKSGRDHEALVLDFSQSPIRLTEAASGKGFRSYLGVIPAAVLAELYQRYGGTLLEGNVRSFLTLKSHVNRDIRTSILQCPQKFFIYNNGIAVTAKHVKFNSQGELIHAEDFQIINGGQTTASLANAVHSDKADISAIQVAIKLTAIDDDLSEADAQELMRNISVSSNNQNKVSSADFTSNHPFHVLMEQSSQRIIAPAKSGVQYGTHWFYERNRGAYLQAQMFKSSSEKSRFQRDFDRKQVVKKEDLSKVRLCWDRLPVTVSKGSAKQFSYFMDRLEKTWDKDRESGRYSDAYFRDSISLVILFNSLRDAVTKQPWYGGYRANIVTYAIAVFSLYFHKKFGENSFNFDCIWQKQAVPLNLSLELLKIAHDVKNVITSPDRQKENVTEWAKLEACWTSVKEYFSSHEYSLPDCVEEWCKSSDQKRDEKRKAKDDAKIDEEVNLQTKVLEYRYWAEAMAFARTHSVLTDRQNTCISKASMMLRTGNLLHEVQCRIALEGLERLRQEGFTH